jgi:uncharacterized membrane protein
MFINLKNKEALAAPKRLFELRKHKNIRIKNDQRRMHKTYRFKKIPHSKIF